MTEPSEAEMERMIEAFRDTMTAYFGANGKNIIDLAREGLASRKAGGASAAKDRHDLLMMLAARPDITGLFGFKEREIFEAARRRNNEVPDPAGETEG